MIVADPSIDARSAIELARAAIERDTGNGRQLDFEDLARPWRELQDALETSLLANPALRPPVEIHKGAQSKHFMLQLVPYVQRWMSESPMGSKFTILDVGPGTGHGANLLASLYATMDLGYQARVSTLDTNRAYEAYMRLFCRFVTPAFGNIFSHRDTYDIVIASHVIEHVKEEPMAFARRLQELAHGIVILCAPYAEPADRLTEGHRHVLDDAFLQALGAESVDLLESPAWGWFREPRYKMFVAILRGTASR